MDINDLRKLKNDSGMTNAEIAELSNIPLEVVNKIFSGEIENPKYMNLLVMEQVMVRKKKMPYYYDEGLEQPCLIREEAVAYNFNARSYTMRDLEKLCIGVRVELINGKLYHMTTPKRIHQFLVAKLLIKMGNHIERKHGGCHIYPAPFGVRLFADDMTWVEPDILVVCKRDKLTERGCDGAPDLVVEIVSPSNATHDYFTKLRLYQQAGVREYWIVNPEEEKVTLVNFEDADKSGLYTYEETIKSSVLEDFEIRIADFIQEF